MYYEGVASPVKMVICCVLLLAGLLSGYLILRSCPRNTRKLKTFLGDIASGNIPDEPLKLIKRENDVAEIEEYANTIAWNIKEKIQQLEHYKSQLERKLLFARKLEAIDLITWHISHDINNCVSVILGNCAMILCNVPPDSPVADKARKVELAIASMTELANTLFTCTGRDIGEKQSVNLSALIRKFSTDLSALATPHVRITYSLDENIPEIEADINGVKTMIINLVQNAVDAMVDRTGEVIVSTGRIENGIKSENEYIINESPLTRGIYLSVTDSGCGIPKEIMPKIFDPFFTTKIRAKGLGLSVVLGIARAHRAVISVKTTPGKGSTFTVFFPESSTPCV
jgi:signal transduction histidine kinase